MGTLTQSYIINITQIHSNTSLNASTVYKENNLFYIFNYGTIYTFVNYWNHFLSVDIACICFRYQLQYNSLHLITGTNIHNTIALLGGYDQVVSVSDYLHNDRHLLTYVWVYFSLFTICFSDIRDSLTGTHTPNIPHLHLNEVTAPLRSQ